MHTIAIVDDESIFREYLRTTIDWNSYGFEIGFEAKNGVEALELLAKRRVDIALVDINMPYMDGIDLAKNLKLKYTNIPIVLITGHSEFEYARQAVRLGVYDYILKPFKKEELILTLLKIKDSLQKSQEENFVVKNNIEILRERTLNTLEHTNSSRVTRAMKITGGAKGFIHENYADNELSVEDIARYLYINSGYLRQIFKKEAGMTITDYIANTRMKKARELMNKSNIRLSEISFMVGYSDASYFSKCFKKHYGCSPSEYENMAK